MYDRSIFTYKHVIEKNIFNTNKWKFRLLTKTAGEQLERPNYTNAECVVKIQGHMAEPWYVGKTKQTNGQSSKQADKQASGQANNCQIYIGYWIFTT